MRRLWQRTMIALARSERSKHWAQDSRAGTALATRFVGGGTPEAAIACVQQLLAYHGMRSSLFYLGEYVDRMELLAENVEAKLAAAERLGRAGLDVHVSVDPTQIGHSIDPALARRHARSIAEVIARESRGRPGVNALMLDMEDAGVVDWTIGLHDELALAGLPVAVTLQAYLRRTEADLAKQIHLGSKVRLVKGAFAAGRDIAFTTRREIKANSRHLIDLMLSRQARQSGFYPIIATHDERLHAFAIERARTNGWRQDEYEFEMLFGVRSGVAQELARQSERVRLYVPFGTDWWPYALRRIGESPRNAVLLIRSLLQAG